MATTTSINPYRSHDSTVSVYQVPEFVVDGEKMLFHALYGNEAYEKLRKLTFILIFVVFHPITLRGKKRERTSKSNSRVFSVPIFPSVPINRRKNNKDCQARFLLEVVFLFIFS